MSQNDEGETMPVTDPVMTAWHEVRNEQQEPHSDKYWLDLVIVAQFGLGIVELSEAQRTHLLNEDCDVCREKILQYIEFNCPSITLLDELAAHPADKGFGKVLREHISSCERCQRIHRLGGV
jgi:flagellar biosynthesis component FlhA